MLSKIPIDLENVGKENITEFSKMSEKLVQFLNFQLKSFKFIEHLHAF